ncbi:hypothetical protein M413DRAFT_33109 [Hebeloma cylindrosporum]|uniref:Uncharacterized protein n=1 Tax=Hebeloma cylindrosporum TaxID=76867 RepID=A0A0C3BTJ3_HEBCY|nr:hypothetical protein M413DRAFT_33109 [Hebeloma cylindrosporum h7]
MPIWSKDVRPGPRLQKLEFFNSNTAINTLLARYQNRTPSHVDFSTIRIFLVNPASQEEVLLAGEIIAIASTSLEKFKLHEQYETKTMVPWLLQASENPVERN